MHSVGVFGFCNILENVKLHIVKTTIRILSQTIYIYIYIYIYIPHTLTTSRWRQMTVLMSELFSHSFNRFVQTADSFRNEASDCLCEWATQSLTHSISSKTWIHSTVTDTTVLQWLWLEQKQSILCLKCKPLILTSCLFNHYCLKSVSHSNRGRLGRVMLLT